MGRLNQINPLPGPPVLPVTRIPRKRPGNSVAVQLPAYVNVYTRTFVHVLTVLLWSSWYLGLWWPWSGVWVSFKSCFTNRQMLNIFCILRKKEKSGIQMTWGWVRWWQYFNIWLNYPFKMIKIKVVSLSRTLNHRSLQGRWASYLGSALELSFLKD